MNLLSRIAHAVRSTFGSVNGESLPHAIFTQRFENLLSLVQQVDVRHHLGIQSSVVADNHSPGKYKHVQYMHIFEDEVMSMGIFLLPKGASLPLHDHPQMMVASKLLFGSVTAKCYDWSPPSERGTLFNGKRGQLARVTRAEKVSAPEILVLTGTENNLHDFEAISEGAMLTLLTPFIGGTRMELVDNLFLTRHAQRTYCVNVCMEFAQSAK